MTAPTRGTSQAVNPADLNLYHRNPRIGNVEAIKESLVSHGQYKPIVVNKGTHTGRENEVLAGNHTLKAIRDLAEEHPDDERWQEVDIWEVDVDDDRAARIVVADNRTSDLGQTDDEALLELLQEMDGLEGTGYEDDDIDDLIALLQESEDYEEEEAEKPQYDEGLSASHSDDDKAETYAERGTRMFVLSFPYAQYSWVAEKLEEYSKEHDDCGDTNTEILLHMLTKFSGEEPPEVSAEEEDEDDDEDGFDNYDE